MSAASVAAGALVAAAFVVAVLAFHDTWTVYQSSLSAGILGGALHALTGADHITAVLPLAVNKRWWSAAPFGLVWGVGHGLTSFALGSMGAWMGEFLLSAPHIARLRWVGDLVVATTLIVIGGLGLLECREAEAEKGADDLEARACSPPPPSPTSQSRKIIKAVALYSSVVVHGASLGLTWDGLPSLGPALVLDRTQALAFLLAYFAATVAAMSAFAGLLGEASCWVVQTADSGLPLRLAALSSLAALALGLCWLLRAGVSLALPLLSSPPPVGSDEANNDGSQLPEPAADHGGAALSFLSLACVLAVLWRAVVAPASATPWLQRLLGWRKPKAGPHV